MAATTYNSKYNDPVNHPKTKLGVFPSREFNHFFNDLIKFEFFHKSRYGNQSGSAGQTLLGKAAPGLDGMLLGLVFFAGTCLSSHTCEVPPILNGLIGRSIGILPKSLGLRKH